MEKVWLPPLEVCCKKAKIELEVFINSSYHIHTFCDVHKNNSFIPNALSHTKLNFNVILSPTVQKYIPTQFRVSKKKRRRGNRPILLPVVHSEDGGREESL